MKIIVKVMLLMFFILNYNNTYAQYSFRYSLDLKSPKKRRVPIGEKIVIKKEQLKKNVETNKKHRIQNRDSRKVRRHTYRLQSKEVKKRMKKSKKKAEYHNKNKIPLKIKLKQMFDG
jgi:preprotein translocase subunit SecF